MRLFDILKVIRFHWAKKQIVFTILIVRNKQAKRNKKFFLSYHAYKQFKVSSQVLLKNKNYKLESFLTEGANCGPDGSFCGMPKLIWRPHITRKILKIFVNLTRSRWYFEIYCWKQGTSLLNKINANRSELCCQNMPPLTS